MLNITVGMTLAEAEKVLITATLAEHKGNKTKTAEVLGITAKTIHAKLKQYYGS